MNELNFNSFSSVWGQYSTQSRSYTSENKTQEMYDMATEYPNPNHNKHCTYSLDQPRPQDLSSSRSGERKEEKP